MPRPFTARERQDADLMHGEPQPNLRRPHHAEAAARPRLPWIDTVRVAVTVLVIAHHCAVTYANIPVWFYNEPPQDPSAYALDALAVLNQTWFMGLFFLLSGYFVRVSVDRHGPRAFARRSEERRVGKACRTGEEAGR